jgi:chemotaxis protein CheD
MAMLDLSPARTPVNPSLSPRAVRSTNKPKCFGPWHLEAALGQDLMLMPGQMYFGGRAASLKTLLGSCLSITLWHPKRRIGGMCHFLLPSRTRQPGEPMDGRYGDEAMEAMMHMLQLTGTAPQDYVAHLYGGADTMPEKGGVRFNVGERNIEQGWKLVDHYGFQLEGIDVGEDVPRTVTLNIATGEIEMRRGSGHAPQFNT